MQEKQRFLWKDAMEGHRKPPWGNDVWARTEGCFRAHVGAMWGVQGFLGKGTSRWCHPSCSRVLSICSAPGTLLGTRDPALSKIKKGGDVLKIQCGNWAGLGRFFTRWSKRASLRQGHLSRDLNEEKKPAGPRPGEEHAPQGEPVQRLEWKEHGGEGQRGPRSHSLSWAVERLVFSSQLGSPWGL